MEWIYVTIDAVFGGKDAKVVNMKSIFSYNFVDYAYCMNYYSFYIFCSKISTTWLSIWIFCFVHMTIWTIEWLNNAQKLSVCACVGLLWLWWFLLAPEQRAKCDICIFIHFVCVWHNTFLLFLSVAIIGVLDTI